MARHCSWSCSGGSGRRNAGRPCAADPFWFLAACSLSLPALAVKGIRWQEILRALGYEFSFAESLGVYAAGSLAGAITPGKVGDLAKAPLLAGRGVPLSAGVAASLLDRVFDAVVFFVVGLGSLLTLPTLQGRAAIAITTAVAIGLTVAAAIVVTAKMQPFSSVARVGVPASAGDRTRSEQEKPPQGGTPTSRGMSQSPAASTSIRWWLVMVVTTLVALAPYFGSAYFCAGQSGFPWEWSMWLPGLR